MSADRPSDDRLLDVADRIGTGERIDFEALARELDGDDAGVLRSLRTLAAIHQLHTSSELPTTTPHGDDDFRPAAGATWGSLELIDEIGRGSYGTVWRARDKRLDREVALKLLRPGRDTDADDRARFLDEGRRLARVDHPHVVRVYGVDEAHGRLGLWMERIEGRTLADLVRDQGRFSAEETAVLGEKIARGLAAVHAAGVVHRDVKAQNVMRADGGRVVLMDFGTAVESGHEDAGVEGTPFYLAPELFERHPADARSDVYSLGVLLYHLVTGSFPVQSTSVADLARAHRDGERRALAAVRGDLPRDFVAVVERALAPDPRDRFASAGEMAHALASLGGDMTVAGMPRSVAPRRERSVPGWVVAAIVGAAAVGLALLAVLSRPDSSDAPPVSLTVQAAFLRYGDFSTEELFDGATVGVDDQLGLRVTPSREAWVYVFNRDAQGRFHVMFPRADFDLANPLPAATTTELPGTQGGEPSAWLVDSVGGQEEVLMVVSTAPLGDLEDGIARLGPDVPLEPARLEGLRGIGGVARRASPNAASGDFFGAVEALGDHAATTESGVWVRKLVLRNPG